MNIPTPPDPETKKSREEIAIEVCEALAGVIEKVKLWQMFGSLPEVRQQVNDCDNEKSLQTEPTQYHRH